MAVCFVPDTLQTGVPIRFTANLFLAAHVACLSENIGDQYSLLSKDRTDPYDLLGCWYTCLLCRCWITFHFPMLIHLGDD